MNMLKAARTPAQREDLQRALREHADREVEAQVAAKFGRPKTSGSFRKGMR